MTPPPSSLFILCNKIRRRTLELSKKNKIQESFTQLSSSISKPFRLLYSHQTENTDCSKNLAPWRCAPSSVKLPCEKNSHRTGNPAANLKSASYYCSIKGFFFLFFNKFYRNGKEALDKRGTYKFTTPCLFIQMAVSLLWTVLFKPMETEMILTLLWLDNNIHCCSIHLWDTHIALRLRP